LNKVLQGHGHIPLLLVTHILYMLIEDWIGQAWEFYLDICMNNQTIQSF